MQGGTEGGLLESNEIKIAKRDLKADPEFPRKVWGKGMPVRGKSSANLAGVGLECLGEQQVGKPDSGRPGCYIDWMESLGICSEAMESWRAIQGP